MLRNTPRERQELIIITIARRRDAEPVDTRLRAARSTARRPGPALANTTTNAPGRANTTTVISEIQKCERRVLLFAAQFSLSIHQ